MDKNDRDSNPDLTKTKDDVKAEETKVVEPPAKSSSGMPKFQIDPSVFDEVPGTHFPTMQAKKKRNPAAMWLVLVLVLFLATGGYAAYQYTQALSQGDTLSQKDSQIAALTSENAKLKSDAAKAEAQPAEPTPADKKTVDKMAITAVVTAKLHAPTKVKDEKLTVNVMKQSDTFAYVNAGPVSGGAAAYILKKVDNQWTIVFSGQDKVSQTDIDTYSIPTEFQSGQ